MPLISNIGRRSLAVRLLVVALYLLVLAGAVTMVYPFMVTVSGSFKTNVDKNDFDAFPAFFTDDTVLWRKHMECKYNNRLTEFNTCNRRKDYEFRRLVPPEVIRRRRVADWKEFEQSRPPVGSAYSLGYMTHAGDSMRLWKHREFRAHLMDLCDGDIQDYNLRFDAQEEQWVGVGAREERLTERRFQKGTDAFTEEFYDFKKSQPTWFRFYPSVDGIYVQNYLAAVHGLDINEYNRKMGTSWKSFRDYVMSRRLPDNELEREDWEHFVREELNLQFIGVDQAAQPLFDAFLNERYAGELTLLNERYDSTYTSFSDVTYPQDTITVSYPLVDWAEFVKIVPARHLHLKTTETDFRDFLKEKYKDDIAALNDAHQVRYLSFDEVPYPENLVTPSRHLEDYKAFLKVVPIEHLKAQMPSRDTEEWETFVRDNLGLSPDDVPEQSDQSAWETFVRDRLRPRDLRVADAARQTWTDFLSERYAGDIAALNAGHDVGYKSFEHIPMPALDVQHADFLDNRKAIRREFMTANYKQVFDYIVLHGSSLINTVIYCGLAVVTALLVNPLAAYALSRYKIPSTYKILLFCMATMAFPPAVTMIPNFLLLRDLGLLNTFAALVLPGVANGFMIFLLKGFFDSLPREMYESAQIDGANEWVMFWQFTMALSKPILAVLALGAFTAAYGNFMFAFILCPKEKMWTLMVFLYQFQQSGGMALTFAALLVAAIPTLVVFIFCQNIIIRGIVVPVEK